MYMRNEKPAQPNTIQMVYGFLLAAAGISIFLRFDQVIPPKLGQFSTFSGAMWFIRFCFYLMGIILIGGGARKIGHYFKAHRSASEKNQVDSADD